MITNSNQVYFAKVLGREVQEEVFGGDIVLGTRILPPPSCFTPQIEGSESPLPSGHRCCGDMPPWCEYGNGPSKPGRF